MTISARGDAGERHDVGQAAEVADAEDLAGDLAEADAEGDVVLVGGVDDELGAVEALGDDDGADRLGVEVGRLGAELQAPGGDGAADALGEAVVAGEDVVEPLLLAASSATRRGRRSRLTGGV